MSPPESAATTALVFRSFVFFPSTNVCGAARPRRRSTRQIFHPSWHLSPRACNVGTLEVLSLLSNANVDVDVRCVAFPSFLPLRFFVLPILGASRSNPSIGGWREKEPRMCRRHAAAWLMDRSRRMRSKRRVGANASWMGRRPTRRKEIVPPFSRGSKCKPRSSWDLSNVRRRHI